MDKIDEDKIEERDEATQQYHRDRNDNGRVTQFLVTTEPLFLWVPRPRTFLQLDFYFTEEAFDFGDHSKVLTATAVKHARRDSNPQPTVLETATLPIELLAYLIFLFRLLFLSLAFTSTLPDGEEEVEEDC